MPRDTGLHTLKILNTSWENSSTCIFNYIDNISLTPLSTDLETDVLNIPCGTGGTVNYALDAGTANAGAHYWIWMSASGSHPGISLNGLVVPLNWDFLFEMGIMNPGFPGSVGFLGVLDGTGKANASLLMGSNHSMNLVGTPICFAYVLTSPGPSLPITYASQPVHVKYIP